MQGGYPMSLGKKAVRSASPGAMTFWVVVIVLILIVAIYLGVKLAPIYQQKWDFEDRMEVVLKRASIVSEDEMFEILQEYADKNKIPVKVWEDCRFEGSPGKPGTLYCDYAITTHFLGDFYVRDIKVRAKKFLPKIPESSF